MLDTDYLKELDRFHLAIKKRVHAQYSGARQTVQYGHGLIFKDYREYIPGDDFRAIDWRVYARTEKFYIKRYEEERNLTIHIIIDDSASMDYGDPRKFDYAAKLGLGFAYMGMKSNEKFEFSTFGNELRIFRPRSGSNRLVNVIDYLSSHKLAGYSNFAKSLRSYKALIKSKALIVLVSDFLFGLDEVRETLQLFKKSEVIVVQVLDANEKAMNFDGEVILEDAETAKNLKTFVTRRMKKTYLDRLYDHIYRLKDDCDAINAKFISVTTNVPVFDTFYHILGKT